MVGTDPDEVLRELEGLGAVGAEPKARPRQEAWVEEIDIEQGPPGAHLRDLRGGLMVELLDEATDQLGAAIEAFDAARTALLRLRDVWVEPSEAAVGAPEALSEPLNEPEAPEPSPEAERPQVRAGEPLGDTITTEVSKEAYDTAIASAVRKIRGEDTPSNHAPRDDEEDVPYVGQVLARPPGQEPEEVSIGTLGSVKPSFPAEESSDGT